MSIISFDMSIIKMECVRPYVRHIRKEAQNSPVIM